MDKNLFGEFFDLNRDGKTTAFEQAVGLSIIDECSKNNEIKDADVKVTKAFKKNRKPGKGAFVFLAIVLLLLSIFVVKSIITFSKYKVAEGLVVEENYNKASEILESFEEDYLNTEDYMLICKAHMSFDEHDLIAAYQYMNQINSNQLPKGSIDAFLKFKETVTNKYEQYIIQQQQEQLKTLKEKVKNGVPFVGMPEEYIDQTIIGKPSEKIRHNWEIKGSKRFLANLYDFYNDEGKIFTARCVDGTVTDIWDYRDAPVKPFVPKKPKPTDDEDPYNASDYSHPEDFYYDHYDDFFDYEDAEDYYNEHTK